MARNNNNTAASVSVAPAVNADGMTAKAEQLLAKAEAQVTAAKTKRELAPNDLVAKRVAQAMRDGKVTAAKTMIDDNGTKTCELMLDGKVIAAFKEWTIDVNGKAAIRRVLTMASGAEVRSAFLDQVTNNAWPKGRSTGGAGRATEGSKTLAALAELGI